VRMERLDDSGRNSGSILLLSGLKLVPDIIGNGIFL
jgi:hypothetical protein